MRPWCCSSTSLSRLQTSAPSAVTHPRSLLPRLPRPWPRRPTIAGARRPRCERPWRRCRSRKLHPSVPSAGPLQYPSLSSKGTPRFTRYPLADLLEPLRAALEGRYAVERLLGQGGMATVYLAKDCRHDRPVAIKVLRPELAASIGADRFLREIKLAANLQHPNILALYDSGDAGGLLYYVMPLVQGESLRARLNRESQLSLPDAIQLTCEVAEALHCAHSRGIVHRDIKPENILIQDG